MTEYRKFIIKKETECKKCIHRKVCHALYTPQSMRKLCKNYRFGMTKEYSCGECICYFGRDQQIPCFLCRFYKKEKAR